MLYMRVPKGSLAALRFASTFHRTTEGLDITLKGKYLVTVTATDSGNLTSNTELQVRAFFFKYYLDYKRSSFPTSAAFVLQIFSVDETHRVELGFTLSEQGVEEKLSDIIRCITRVTVFWKSLTSNIYFFFTNLVFSLISTFIGPSLPPPGLLLKLSISGLAIQQYPGKFLFSPHLKIYHCT